MLARTKRLKLFAIAGALVATELAVLTLGSPTVSALTNQYISPIPANMTHWGSGNPGISSITSPNSNMIRHVIKKEGSSTMERVQLAAYFSEAAVNAAHRVTITDRDTRGNAALEAERCDTFWNNNNQRNNFIRVTLSTETRNGGVSSAPYIVRGDRVCQDDGVNGSRFFGTYAPPAGFVGANCATGTAKCDEDTGLYKLNITIEYLNVPVASGNHKQQVAFRVGLNSSGCVTGCVRYLSITPANDLHNGVRNYSTLGEYREYGNPWYTDQRFQFGLPCKVRNGTGEYTIQLYDVDNQGAAYYEDHNPKNSWGESNDDTRFRIESSSNGSAWSPISFTRVFSNPTAARQIRLIDNVTSSDNTWFRPADGSGNTARIRFFMEPNVNYRMVVYRVHNRNLLGVGLPTATIYGDINCNYNLEPEIQGGPSTVSPGSLVPNIRGNVRNDGAVSSYGYPGYGNPQAGVVRFVVPAGQTPATGRGATNNLGFNTAAAAGCELALVASSSRRDCTVLGTGSHEYVRNANIVIWAGNDNLAGLTLNGGDRVCYMTYVNLYNQQTTPNDWMRSVVQCSLVLTQPKVAIWGNDLRVGSGFSGMPNANARVDAIVARESASWVEYAITAPSSVTGIASQSGAVNGSSDGQPLWSKLTFANTATPPACPAAFGCFTGTNALGSIPNVRAAVDSMSYGGSTLNYNVGSFSASGIGSIIGSATDLGNFNRSVSITSSGTITIDRDIIYNSGAIAGEGAIPQLILIGNNINIAAGVHRVDAWLIAADTINTCDGVAVNQSNLRSNMCNEQLRINGPVMANQLALNRTYADASGGQAAETINLRGDAYVWASRAARQNGHWQTIYTTELPPRY